MQADVNILADEELAKIHDQALDILKNTGIEMPSEKAKEFLSSNGARIEDDIVYIPEDMVEEALQTVPKRDELTLYGREEKHNIDIAQESPVLAGMVQATQVIDPETREKRPIEDKDVAKFMRMMNKLDNISINSPLGTPQNFPDQKTDWHTWVISIINSEKHITGPAINGECVEAAVEMGSVIRGSREKFQEKPFFSVWVLTQPPLHVDAETLSTLITASENEVPAIISSGPMMGVSSPVTLAGSVAQVHAEILSCIVLSQLANRGAPVVYTSFARIMDMKVSNISMASPEFALTKVAISQLGHKFNLPTRMPSMLRDAKTLDAQAGFETGMCGVMGAMEADIIDGIQLDMDIVVDFADPVFCNEAMGQVRRVARGIEVDEKTLVRDLLDEVGHGGDFLSTIHTAENFKDEFWLPEITERRMWEDWEEDGALDMEERALAQAKELLTKDTGPSLERDVQERIKKIAENA